MSCFVLCQNCGEVFDSWLNHSCDTGMMSGYCEYCGQQGDALNYDSQTFEYSHKDLRECIKNLREEIDRTGGDCRENDIRFCKIEKKLSDFVEGRRAAVEATKEKLAIRQDDST